MGMFAIYRMEFLYTPQPVVAVFPFAAALTQSVVTGSGLEIVIFGHSFGVLGGRLPSGLLF